MRGDWVMSYEGHEQVLCKNGHYSIVDAYDMYEFEEWRCGICNEPRAFHNAVDNTNCEAFGEIDINQFKIKEKVIEQCPTCNHKKIIEEEIYRIPTEEERQKARCYRPEYGDSPLIPIPFEEEEQG